jgi:predicted nuclease of predicted toxin-antitoxin system
MKILLDECVPVQIRDALLEHAIHSATDPQWRGLSNGELLRLAEQQEFQLIVVADKNMRYQQNLASRKIAILELWTNHRPTLEQHFQYISAAVERLLPGQYLELTAPAPFPRK